MVHWYFSRRIWLHGIGAIGSVEYEIRTVSGLDPFRPVATGSYPGNEEIGLPVLYPTSIARISALIDETEYAGMLQPDVYWIREIEKLRLAIMPRPRNGEWLADEISGWHRLGLRCVVSLLEIDESRELGLADEESLCGAAGLKFLSFPIPDRGVPRDHTGFAGLVDTLAERLRSGDSVGIHCRAGIGRSGLLGACILGALEVPPEYAFAMLSRARGVTVPDTDAQVDWVRDFVRTRSAASRH